MQTVNSSWDAAGFEGSCTDSVDPLELYDELVMSGSAPDPRLFARRYPERPDLLERIEALDALRGDLDHLARGTSHHTPVENDTIGNFRVLQPLGRGGMGDVFLALQSTPSRHCALKLLRHTTPLAKQRFEREADLAARLTHPGIARVFAYGFDGEQAYLATEHVEGASLNLVIKASISQDPWPPSIAASELLVRILQRPLTAERATQLARKVAEALAHAHAHGVVHRDVKPSNIMVTDADDIKLIDFGIALPWLSGDRLTKTGIFVGSQQYAAPEQLGGHKNDIGPWTDTYALGATLYQMLAGRLPFPSPSDVAEKRRRGPRKGPRSHNRSVSRALNHLVQRALCPKISRRYIDGEQMAAALRACEK